MRHRIHRHIECVRNYISACIRELLDRQVTHDQSKFSDDELPTYVALRAVNSMTYGSPEYKAEIAKHAPAIAHHHALNRHHAEFFENGYRGMNLIDFLELMCDWKASTMRHADGDLFKSIEYNAKKYGYSDDLVDILKNTAKWLNEQSVYHKASES